jgi:hypothetical protein
MSSSTDELLSWLCHAVYAAEAMAEKDCNLEAHDDGFFPELLVMRRDRVRVEIRKEQVAHHEPHLHVVHSDKIDASISLNSFRVLAGTINPLTHKYLVRLLLPKQPQLNAIWEELNDKDNSVGAEKLIANLGL